MKLSYSIAALTHQLSSQHVAYFKAISVFVVICSFPAFLHDDPQLGQKSHMTNREPAREMCKNASHVVMLSRKCHVKTWDQPHTWNTRKSSLEDKPHVSLRAVVFIVQDFYAPRDTLSVSLTLPWCIHILPRSPLHLQSQLLCRMC